MIVSGLLFRCGLAIESIPQRYGKIGVRTRSAGDGNTMYSANIPEIIKY
jgi:hypothetical protein